MYFVDWLENCSFGSVLRFIPHLPSTPLCPAQSDLPTANWTHQDKNKETSQPSQDSQTSVAQTVFEGERGVWRWARGVCGADATTARTLYRCGLKMCSAVLCFPQKSGNAAVRLPKGARNRWTLTMIPLMDETGSYSVTPYPSISTRRPRFAIS